MIALLCLALAGVAFAQEVDTTLPYAIDFERFRPPADTFGYANTHSSATLGHLQVGVGLWGTYVDDPLVLTRDGQRIIGPGPEFPDGMIDTRSVVNLQAGIGLGNVFSFTFDLPVVVWQEGFEPAGPGSTSQTNDLLSSGVGDLRLTPKFTLLNIEKGRPVGLALLAEASVPTGSERSFIGEGDPTITPMAVLELADGSVRDREHHVRFALNAGGRFKAPDAFHDVPFTNELIYRAGFAIAPSPAIELGVDLAGVSSGGRNAQNPLELLPWLKLLPVDIAVVTMGAGIGLIEGAGAPDFRVFGGATLGPKFDPRSMDRDGDGIPNKYDACPNVPEDIDGFEDHDGCPDPDNDGDGILDIYDACPNDPEDFDGFEDEDGCPDLDNDGDGIPDLQDACPNDPEDFDGWMDHDGCPDPDNDGDGILDIYDACPNAAETFNGFQDEDGCPDDKPFVDTDGDGYSDDIDKCPFEPEDFDGFQDEDGCPDPDNDGDGILDIHDACPNDPETFNGYQDEDGCPDVAPSRVMVERTHISISEMIFFEVNKADIKQVSFDLCDEIANVIIENPDVRRIRVEGHTDSDGPDSYNLRLSQSRAESVVAYLVSRGVEPARLEPVGFGESRPIVDNNSPENKAKNRRVEFVIVERDR